MSFETELTRVAEGTKDTLKKLINKMGGTVADEKIDGYPELAEAIEFEDIEFEEGQPKITVSGILKGDGEGNITAAIEGVDYISASDCDDYFEEQTISNLAFSVTYDSGIIEQIWGPFPCYLSSEDISSDPEVIFRDVNGSEFVGVVSNASEEMYAVIMTEDFQYMGIINYGDGWHTSGNMSLQPHSLYIDTQTGASSVEYFVMPASITICGQTFYTSYNTTETVIKTKHLPEALRFGKISSVGEAITWDGNTTNLVGINNYYFRISDSIITEDQLSNGYKIVTTNSESGEQNSTSFSASNVGWEGGVMVMVGVVVCPQMIEIEGVTYPAGIYFAKEDAAYVSELVVPGAKFPQTKLVKMDSQYLPDITSVKETNAGLDQKFWRGTKEEFDAVETKSDDTLYIVTDDSSGATVDPSSYIPSAYLAALSASSWDADTLSQTVTVPGILADESKQMIIPMPTIACMSAYNDAGIQLTNQAANALTFTAQEVPTDDIQIYVSFQNVNLVTG